MDVPYVHLLQKILVPYRFLFSQTWKKNLLRCVQLPAHIPGQESFFPHLSQFLLTDCFQKKDLSLWNGTGIPRPFPQFHGEESPPHQPARLYQDVVSADR